MHVIRKNNQELAIADSSIWLSACLACATLIFLWRTLVIHGGGIYYLAGGFLGLFALLFWRREVVIFDSGRQQAVWNRRRLLGVTSGAVPFSDIEGIGMEASYAKNNVRVYRLAILTPHGAVPMSDNYAGDLERYETLKREILDFLKLDSGRIKPASDSL